MKQHTRRIILTAALAVLFGVLAVSSALAGTSLGGGSFYGSDSALLARLNALHPFKFDIHKNGIGYGSCPVYSAPSESAFRAAGGRASCQTNQKMDEAGFDATGWLLVRYETNAGSVRVGYIPPKYVKGFRSSMAPHFDYIPAVAGSELYVTDNPMRHGDAFARLEAGESFHVLSKYDYYKNKGLEWWYIECIVDGQTARGFIEMDSDFTLSYGD